MLWNRFAYGKEKVAGIWGVRLRAYRHDQFGWFHGDLVRPGRPFHGILASQPFGNSSYMEKPISSAILHLENPQKGASFSRYIVNERNRLASAEIMFGLRQLSILISPNGDVENKDRLVTQFEISEPQFSATDLDPH